MGRHIVQALHGVEVVRLALRHYVVEDLVEVMAHVRIGVLVDGEAA